ncbi:hypothetical protein ACFXAE_04390 [Streptomyces sp. NPDC059454]|uniref:hypothetical protein n=1 Tax=Streptomyces sp. NPDC059454 TaxID=3346836 RepID=UPI003678EE64
MFEAVLDGVEEAVLNSLLAARTTTGFHGRTVPALPADRLLTALTAGPPPCHARAPLFEARQRPAAPEGA